MLLPLPRSPGFIRGGVPRIDLSNQMTQGLTGFWLPALHGLPIIINLVNSRPGSVYNFSGGQNPYLDGFPAGQGISSIGPGVRLNFNTYYWNVGPNKNFYDTSATFAFSRISAASDNALNQYGFSVTGASQTSFVPYSDGNIYWDFPNSGSRLGSLAYTNSANLETFTFSARPGYRGIYKNGLQIGTSSAAAAGDGSTNGADLWFGFGGPTAQYFVMAVWNRSLTDQEQIGFTLDPLQFLQWPEDDLFAQMVGAAASASFTYFPMTQPDMAFLLRQAEMVGY